VSLVVLFAGLLALSAPVLAQDKPGRGSLEVRAWDLGGDEVVGQVFVDGIRLGITPLQEEVSPGFLTVEVRAAEGRWRGRVWLDDGEKEGRRVVVLDKVSLRLGLGAAAGLLIHKRKAHRSHANTELQLGLRFANVVAGVAAFGFVESPNHLFVRPEVIWYPIDQGPYLRAGVPVRVWEGFDMGVTLGPGYRLGRHTFGLFVEATASLLARSAWCTIPLEGRLGIEVLF